MSERTFLSFEPSKMAKEFKVLDDATIERSMAQFWCDGFVLFESAISPSVALGALKSAERMQGFTRIFKTVGVSFDDCRLQASIRGSQLRSMRTAASGFVRQLRMGWPMKNWVVLKSLAGGGEQDPHRDFPSVEIGQARQKDSIQGGIIIGLMPNTKLIVYKGCFTEANPNKRMDITFSIGDIIVFRGDLVHAGSSFEQDNLRLHCMLLVRGVKCDGDATELAPPTMHKCQYCQKRASTAKQISNHTRYCRSNPRRVSVLTLRRENDRKPKTCNLCGRTFPSGSLYYQHRHRAHRDQIQRKK